MEAELKEALAEKLLAMADDELILGHRDSEWAGHAPILEEDIAFANIALDEMGHAKIWYSLVAELHGEDPDAYADRLVFFREAGDYRSARLVELPTGDWAFSITRQYVFDAYEIVALEQLAHSQYPPLAEAAVKIRREELYHYRHTHAWVQRLGLGTEESQGRMQRALDQLWPEVGQLFEPLPGEAALVEAGYVPAAARIRAAWEQVVFAALAEASLQVPTAATAAAGPRDQHTPHLAPLLAEMQEVARLNPDARW